MAHIIDFNISGLAGRSDDYGQRLNRDVNIFFGLNGSGKTSLLRILNSALSNDAVSLLTVPFKKAELTIHSAHYEKDFVYSIKHQGIDSRFQTQPTLFEGVTNQALASSYRFIQNEVIYSPPYAWKVTPSLPEDAAGAWQHRFLPTSRLVAPIDIETVRRGSPDEFFDLQFENVMQQLWSRFFAGLQNRVRKAQERGLADILNEVLSPTAKKKDSVDDLSWSNAYDKSLSFLRRQNPNAQVPPKSSFQTRFESGPLLRSVVGHIDRVEQEISEAMQPQTKLETLIARMFSGPKKLEFGTRSIDVIAQDKSSIGLRSLSSGEKQILRILLETLQAEASSLLIDEPELSMHVDWQRELIPSMRELNSDSQLILATHSPEIMADISDSRIFKI